jgi:hypothetical protein
VYITITLTLYSQFIYNPLVLQNKMSKTIKCLTNHESRDKTLDRSLPAVFILCDTCYWCATYLDKTRVPIDNNCPQCNTNNNELSSMPIMHNESFTFDHSGKCGIEFKPRSQQ